MDRAYEHRLLGALADDRFDVADFDAGQQGAALVQIIGQVAYSVYLAEQGDKVREKCWTIWVNDMSNVFAEAGGLSREDCSAYLWSLANRYRDEKRREQVAGQ